MSQQPFSSNGGFVTPGNVNASTYTAEPNEAVNVQALFDDNNIGSKLLLDPNNTYTQLAGYSGQDSNSWTDADWSTGVYTTEGGGTIGAIQFTGATAIIDYVNALPNPDYVYVQVNGGPLLASQGWSGGVTNITFYVAELPATDPTTVTSFTYYFNVSSFIEMDYDNQEFNIEGNGLDIVMSTRDNSDIEINSIRNLNLIGNGSYTISNFSTTNSIEIQTNAGGAGQVWNYGNTGILTLPGEGIIQSNDDTIILQSKDTGTGNIYSLRVGTNGGLYFASTEYPAGWLDITNNAGNASISSPISSGGAAGHNLTITAGTTDQGVFTALPGGALNLTGGTGGFNDDGVGGPGGDVNIIAGSPGEAGGVAGNVYINAGTADWTFNNQSQLKVANLTIAATNGIGAQASVVEDNGSLAVLATGTNGVVNIGWSDTTLLGNTAVMWFNEPGNVGNAVIRTGNTADTSYTWAFDNAGNLTLPGNTFAVNYANGTPVTFAGGSYGDSNVVTLLGSFGNNTVATSGNVSSGNLTVTGQITGTYTPATATGAGIVTQGANTIGGIGYFDFLEVTNQSGGANNASKTFRVNSTGAVEVINSAYSATILSLSDSGNLSVIGSGSNVTRRAFGLVAADVNVTLDDLSANVTSSTSQLALSTSGSWQGTGWTETFTSGTPSVQTWVNLPLSSGFTSASGAMNSQGQGCRCVISDQTPNAKVYQITVVRSGTTGAQWNISIERLV